MAVPERCWMKQTPIHSLVLKASALENQRRTKERAEGPPRLHMSGMGRCVRAGYLSTFEHVDGHPLQRKESHPFSNELLIKFEHGRMYEDQLAEELLIGLGNRELVEREPRLGNDIWAGQPDFVIQSCDEFPDGALVDCKATGEYVFAYTMARIPRITDALQVLAYQRFLGIEGRDVPAFLYYRGWGAYGEIEVWERDGLVHYDGHIKGHEVGGFFEDSLRDRMARFEDSWHLVDLPYVVLQDIPGQAGPFDSTFGCLRKSRDKYYSCCRFLSNCWPQFQPGDEGPFERPEEEEAEEVF